MQYLATEIDHVAIAVPDRTPAISRFVNEMGAGVVASGRRSGSTIDQLKFRNGNKLEILGPDLQHKLGNRMIDFLEISIIKRHMFLQKILVEFSFSFLGRM